MNSLRYICNMWILRRLFNFYINSSMHVALSVCAFTFLSYGTLSIACDLNLIFFIFFGTVTGYNFVKYAGIAQLHHASLKESLKIIQVFSMLCFVLCAYFAFQMPINVIMACIPLGLLTLFYAVPLFPKKKNLRTVPTFKIFVIAAVWSGTTVYLPVINQNMALDTSVCILILQRFLIVLALILPFEIRDVAYDNIKLGTFPQMLGIKQTKNMGYILLFLFLVLTIFDPTLDHNESLITFTLAGFTLLGIYFAQVDQADYYCSFWVEGIPIFCWAGSLLLR